MEQYLLLAIVILFLAVLIIFAAILYVLIKKFASFQTHEHSSPSNHQKKTEVVASYCENHPNEQAQGICAICEGSYCEKCLKEDESLNFCPEHFNTYLENSWLSFHKVRTTPTESENGIILYSLKQNLWQRHGIPTYIITHYKIDVESDIVESHVHLYVREGDKKFITENFSTSQ